MDDENYKQPTKEQMENKLMKERRGEEVDIPDTDNITIKKGFREKAFYRGQKTGEVWEVYVPFKDGGFQTLTFDKKEDAEKYVKEIKRNKNV